MKDYERLTRKAENGKPYFDGCLCCDLESDCGLCPYWESGINRLAELEDMIENGTLQHIPFKEGDTAYFETYTENGSLNLGVQPHKITGVRISALYVEKYGQTGHLPLTSLGKRWFLNEVEARENKQ